MPGWIYRKTKQPNLGTGTYQADKGCTKGEKHPVFPRPFNLNLQFHQPFFKGVTNMQQ